jgi:hypothetical protein
MHEHMVESRRVNTGACSIGSLDWPVTNLKLGEKRGMLSCSLPSASPIHLAAACRRCRPRSSRASHYSIDTAKSCLAAPPSAHAAAPHGL